MSSLEIPFDLLGTSQTEEEEIAQSRGTQVRALNAVKRLGLPILTQPQDAGFPSLELTDLTTTDAKEYMETYLNHVNWFTYLNELKALVDNTIQELQNELEDIAARTRRSQRDVSDKKLTKEEVNDRLRENPTWRALDIKLQEEKQALALLRPKIEGLYRKIQLMSRTIEVRKLDAAAAEAGRSAGGKKGAVARHPVRSPVLNGLKTRK